MKKTGNKDPLTNSWFKTRDEDLNKDIWCHSSGQRHDGGPRKHHSVVSQLGFEGWIEVHQAGWESSPLSQRWKQVQWAWGMTSAPCLTCRCEGPRRKKAELEVSSFYSVRELETCKGSSAGKKPDKGWVSDTTPATVRKSVCPQSLAH